MTTLMKAAGVPIEPIWPSLFAKALDGKYIIVADLLTSVGLISKRLCYTYHDDPETSLSLKDGSNRD